MKDHRKKYGTSIALSLVSAGVTAALFMPGINRPQPEPGSEATSSISPPGAEREKITKQTKDVPGKQSRSINRLESPAQPPLEYGHVQPSLSGGPSNGSPNVTSTDEAGLRSTNQDTAVRLQDRNSADPGHMTQSSGERASWPNKIKRFFKNAFGDDSVQDTTQHPEGEFAVKPFPAPEENERAGRDSSFAGRLQHEKKLQPGETNDREIQRARIENGGRLVDESSIELSAIDWQQSHLNRTSPQSWRESASQLGLKSPTAPDLGTLESIEIRGEEVEKNLREAQPAKPALSNEEKKIKEQKELVNIKKQLGLAQPENNLKGDLYDPWAKEYDRVVDEEKKRVERLAREALQARRAEEKAKRNAQKGLTEKR